MNRGEKFALGAGLVGLAFDLVVAVYFFSPESPLRRGLSLSPPRLSAMVGVMTYGWLLVTWVLVRRAMRNAKRRHRPSEHTQLPRSELAQKTRMTVAGTGLVMLPVQFAMLGNYLTRSSPVFQARDVLEWYISIGFLSLATLLVIGLCIYACILQLMPIIYHDVHKR
jgi:type VI protein secretion system component VasK